MNRVIGTASLHLGDCLEVLRSMADNSVDSIVTDPPYGLNFMGKKWDYDVPSVEIWAECLRVIKPGGHLLAFAGTRTQHRMAVRIEDAGFEIRDMIAWVYGSGFPKSLDVSKAIDKARRRDYVQVALDMGLNLPGRNVDDWTKEGHAPGDKWWSEFKAALPPETWQAIERRVIGSAVSGQSAWFARGVGDVTAPATEAARQWQGWGTALKPALEPITVARKPLVGTVAENVLAHGTGALNIDGCRVDGPGCVKWETPRGGIWSTDSEATARLVQNEQGRWPANLIHDGSDEVLAAFPLAPGQQGDLKGHANDRQSPNGCFGKMAPARDHAARIESDKSAARFFYCAKASRKDRNDGLHSGEAPAVGTSATMRDREDADWQARNGNHHPTVKPTDLMAYLCRLVTPAGGIVLDPFMGSGSTGRAAGVEQFKFVGIEINPDYFEIACRRIDAATAQQGLEFA